MSKLLSRSTFALLSLLACEAGFAGPCETKAAAQQTAGRPSPNATLYLAAIQPCFGSAEDNDALTSKVRAMLASDTPLELRVQHSLEILKAAVVSTQSPLAPEAQKGTARSQLELAAVAAKAAVAPGNPGVAVTDWELVLSQKFRALNDWAVDDYLQAKCVAGQPTADCGAALAAAHAWLRLAALTKLALGEYSKDYMAGMAALSKRRLKMWHAYRDEGLPQFPWEYGLNSWRMGRADGRPPGPDGKNPLGYETIPTSQFIFLHPGASLEWRDAKQNSTDSNVKPALYLEVFGINRWSWDQSTGDMVGGSGISLMVSYANRDGAKSTGYGLMFHSRVTKQFTLGITRAGDETVFLVNVDLAEYAKEQLGYWKDIQRKIDEGQ